MARDHHYLPNPNDSQVFLLASFLGRFIPTSVRLFRIINKNDNFDQLVATVESDNHRSFASARAVYVSPGLMRIFLALAWLTATVHPRFRRQRCLFISLVIMDWAWSIGLEPELNVGLENLDKAPSGHCWLTLGGSPLCDLRDNRKRFPLKFSRQGKVVYWLGRSGIEPEAKGQGPS